MQSKIVAKSFHSSCRLWVALAAASLGCFSVAVAPAAAQGTFPAGFSRLAFQDEFEGTTLDRGTWCTRLPNGNPSEEPKAPYIDPECQIGASGRGDFYDTSKEQQRYRDVYKDVDGKEKALHVLSGGTLKLTAVSRIETEKADLGTWDRFYSSMIRSKWRFAPKAGIKYLWTQRVKLPDLLGTFPAAWLHEGPDKTTGETSWPPEIDLFEAPYNNSGQKANNCRMASSYGKGENPSPPDARCPLDYPLPDYCSGEAAGECTKPCFTYIAPTFEPTWHNYTANRSLRDTWLNFSLKWDENEICYYIDNEVVKCEIYWWRNTDGKAARPAQIIFNFAIGGTWAGQDGNSTVGDMTGKTDPDHYPTAVELDYERVYWQAPGDSALKIVRAGKS